MPKVKLEKVTGVVALSYLVLIPVGGYLAYKKIQLMDKASWEMWDKLNMPHEHDTDVSIETLHEQFSRKLDTAR